MKKNGRRVLGLLLLLIMMFTLVPSPNIFALDEEEESVAVESEVTPEEQVVEIANEILSDLDSGENKEETSEQEITEAEDKSEDGISVETVSEEVEEEKEEVEELPAEDDEYELPPFTAEAANFEVTAVTTNKAFDVPVKLVASVIPENDEAYKEAEDALADSGKQYDGMLALDIHFEDDDQNEVEPNRPVSVSFTVKKAVIEKAADDTSLIAPETVEVNHITTDDAGNTVAETVADVTSETDGNVEVTSKGESVEQIDSDFSVDGFSTFTITWTNSETGDTESAEIHWGIKNNGVFEEFDKALLDTTAASVSLANSFEGYYYLSAECCAPGVERGDGVDILSILKKADDGSWVYTKEANDDAGTPEQDVALQDGSNIYAYYYKPEEPNPSGGGSASIPAPTTTKKVEANDDGTYTITLDVQGTTVHEDDSHYANVLIILDATQSMGQNGGAKWTNAKAAMKALIETLTEGENAQNAGKIDFALVTFGRAATVVQNWTKNNTAFKSTCAGISMVTTSGTNWEAGMRGGLYGVLNNMPDDDPTYVIFLTDGDPNTYYDRNNQQDEQGGTGYTDTGTRPGYNGNSTTSKDRAKDEARKIAALPTKLYGIYCADSGTSPSGESFNRLDDLIRGQGQGGQKAIAANANTIEQEFKIIAETIVKDLGASDVSVDDGVPSLSSISAAVAGEASGFEYQIKTNDGEYTDWAQAPGASYSNDNGVTWDLSTLGVIQPGTTYRLKFVVWPSQAAYDTIADLNNGVITMTDDELAAAGIAKPNDDNPEYTLKTNTHLNVSYSFGNETYTDKPYGDELPQAAMDLPTKTIKVEKKWNNLLDQHLGKPVRLEVTRDGELYLYDDEDKGISNAVEVNEESGWVSDSIYISMGQIKKTSSEYEVIEPGHDYEVVEPEEFSYIWELTSEVYHPMVINGTPTMLIKDDNPSGTDGEEYYVIGEQTYRVGSASDIKLTAVNDRRSWLQIEKSITGQNAPTDELFEFTITLTDPKEEDVWFSAFDPTIEYIDDDGQTKYGAPVKELETNATPEEGDTGYFHSESGSNITVKIKAGWTLRFTNLRSGTEYTINETSLPDGFHFVSAEGRVQSDATPEAQQDEPIPAVVSEMEASGTINVPNCEFYVDYTNEYVETSVTATKVWEDADNQDGKRDDVTFILLADGEVVTGKSQVISKTATGDDLTVTWTGLPVYINNEEVEYTVEEDDVENGKITLNGAEYSVSVTGDAEQGFTITNSYTPETTTVKITKAWEDSDNQDGIRPESVEVVLKGTDNKTYQVTLDGTADTEPTGTAATGYESKAWEATFVNLPKNAAGEAIEYSADETKTAVITGTDGVGTYAFEVTGDATSGFTVTNTHTPEKTSVKVTKVWVDNSDQDGIRPDSLTLTLNVPTGVTAPEPKVTKNGDSWTYEWTGLPKYSGGKEITYTVTEGTVPTGYSVTGSPANNNGTITNTHTPDVITVKITKAWEDSDNQDGIRPESVEVVLKGTDNKTYQVTLDGTADTEPTGTAATGYESEAWVATFVNLPKNAAGEAIEYSADETKTTVITGTDGVGTYAFEVTGDATSGFTVTNTHTPEKTSVKVTKVWVDNSDQDGVRPDSLTLTLNVPTGVTASEPKVTKNGDSWTYEWTGLPKYSAGELITYTVTEGTVPTGYSVTGSPANNNGTITNTHTPDVITVKITKVWSDGDDQDGIRPESVEVVLKGTDNKTYQVTLDGTADTEPTGTAATGYESKAWEATFVNLPKNAAGEAIEYSADETKTAVITGTDGVGTYAFEVTGDATSGFTVTNTHTPTTIDIIVNKVWEDNEDKEGLRPETIKINLLADGVIKYTVELDGVKEDAPTEVPAGYESAAWEATFVNLPYFKIVDGVSTKIEYQITEDAVEGYMTSIEVVEEEVSDETDSETSDDEATQKAAEIPKEIKYTVTNTLVNLKITKIVENYYDADGDSADTTSNATFVFKIEIENEEYLNYAGITFTDHGIGTTSLLGIPYKEGDKITVTEIYAAGHKLISDPNPEVKWDEEEKCFTVSFTNTYSTPGYGSGIVNNYTHGDDGNPVINKQQEVR